MLVRKRGNIRKEVMLLAAKIVKLVCLDLLIMYLIVRLPIPLLVIPMMGCMVVYTIDQIKEIRNVKTKGKKRSSRNKKVKSTKS